MPSGGDLGTLPGVGQAIIEYVPGRIELRRCSGATRTGAARSGCRSTIRWSRRWRSSTASSATASRLPVPCLGDRGLTLKEIATLIAERLVDLYRPGSNGESRPAMAGQPPFHDDPHWQDLLLFYEYFHADTGQGLGAAHQTGWTGLLANLVMRQYPPRHPGILARTGSGPEAKPRETPGPIGRSGSTLRPSPRPVPAARVPEHSQTVSGRRRPDGRRFHFQALQRFIANDYRTHKDSAFYRVGPRD